MVTFLPGHGVRPELWQNKSPLSAQFAKIQLQVRLGWQREKPGSAAKNPFAVMTRHLFTRITPDKAFKKIGPALSLAFIGSASAWVAHTRPFVYATQRRSAQTYFAGPPMSRSGCRRGTRTMRSSAALLREWHAYKPRRKPPSTYLRATRSGRCPTS